jgi:hypothetical protein
VWTDHLVTTESHHATIPLNNTLTHNSLPVMSNQLVLVTGISGFVATHVALEFLKNGHRVRGTVRSQEKAEIVRKTPVFEPFKEQLSFVVVEDLVTGDFIEAGRSRVFSLFFFPFFFVVCQTSPKFNLSR